jgi:CBS domain-containing protein
MYKHILVALDGRPASEQALKQAIGLATVTGASLTAISVIERLPAYAASVGEVQEVKDESERFFGKIQLSAVQRAEARGVLLKTAIRAGHAAQTIARYAEESGVDLIVVGSDRQRGLGSTADKITENVTCSVLVARVSLPSVKVRDAMTREVTSIGPSTSLSQVVELLDEKGIKSLPVVEEGNIVGIITGGDLLARAGMGLRLSLHEALPAALLAEEIRRLAQEGKTAKDIMTSPVVTISEDEHITKAAALMNEKNIKRVPVLNKKGELVGIISGLDFLELVASGGHSSEIFPGIHGESARTAGDIMFRDVPTVSPDASLNEVVNKILSTPLRRVVVTDDERRILGTIADRDLIKASPHGKTGALQTILSHLSHAPSAVLDLTGEARDVMIRDVFTVSPDSPLGDVIQSMIEKRVKRLVVADAQKRLVGMVSRESLVHAMAGASAGTA